MEDDLIERDSRKTNPRRDQTFLYQSMLPKRTRKEVRKKLAKIKKTLEITT